MVPKVLWRDRSGSLRPHVLRRWWCISEDWRYFPKLWPQTDFYQMMRLDGRQLTVGHTTVQNTNEWSPPQGSQCRSFSGTSVPVGLWSVPHRWPRASCWEGRTSSPSQPLASRFWHMKQLPWSQLGCAQSFTDMFLRKCTAARWDGGELSCGYEVASCLLESGVPTRLLPAMCFFSGLVQGELRACGMCWSLVPAPVNRSRAICLPPRRTGLTTSRAFAGWGWGGVFFSVCLSAGDVGQTSRFCVGTDEIEAM